jgi:hypothetical protein
LTSTNDGTGRLFNADANADVVYGVRDWGVNLVWADTSLWRVQAEGGPNLMKGQAVAIRVWGGGWLRYGHQTWGVNLVFDDEPHYEWYVLGGGVGPGTSPMAGDELDRNGPLALWNKTTGRYLIHSYQTWGINLDWFSPAGSEPPPPPPPATGIKTYRLINCTWPEAHTLQMWVKDLTVGTAWTHVGSAPSNWTSFQDCGPVYHSGTPFSYNVPTSGRFYRLIAVDADPDYCSLAEPNPNIAFNCVRWDSTPFLGTTTSTLVATATVP